MESINRSPPSASGHHIPALDGLRGLAIVMVLLFHLPAPFPWMRGFTSIGWVGVDLFFVLSGYLITGILYSSAGRPNYYRNFYIRRSLRVFPLYYGFLLVTLFILPHWVDPYYLGLDKMEGRRAEFLLYYSNYATVLTEWPPEALGAFWSLAVEEHFYLVWPFFIWVTPKRRLLLWCAIFATAVLLGRLVMSAYRVPWPALYYLSTSRADALAIGGMAAIVVRLHPGWPSQRAILGAAGLLAATLSAVAVWRGGLEFNDWPMRTVGYTLLALMFACIVHQAGTTQGLISRAFENRVLVTFGKYSYALYIFHMLVLKFCERWIGPKVLPSMGWSATAPLPLFLVCLILTCVLAYLSWHLMEKRLLALKDVLTR